MLTPPPISPAQQREYFQTLALQHPGPQQLGQQYFDGRLDEEELAVGLLADVAARWAATEQLQREQAAEAAQWAIDEAGIRDSEHRSEPLFIRADAPPATSPTPAAGT